MEERLTHLDESGAARMVDVAAKPLSRREAIAEAFVSLQPATLRLIASHQLPKGDVAAVCRIAGIQAAKRTSELIPLCHPLPLTRVAVELTPAADGMRITATVGTVAQTGVEMEALTAASVAALTLYDMCKAVDKGMVLQHVRLLRKSKEPPAAP